MLVIDSHTDPSCCPAPAPAPLPSQSWGRFLLTAARAVFLYQDGFDYILRDERVVIIDTATGRERDRSRWSYGLHQALEAYEGGWLLLMFSRGSLEVVSLLLLAAPADGRVSVSSEAGPRFC